MPNVTLNGRRLDWVTDRAEPWEGILARIDRELEGSGTIVTCVRFDGVEEPGFRDEIVTGRLVQPDAAIDVEAGEASSFLRRCLDEAAQSLPALSSASREIGRRFRAGEVIEANRGLVDLADSLGTVVALVATSSAAIGVPLEQLLAGDQSAADIVNDLHARIDHIASAQRSQDWIALAECLEGALPRVIDAWPLVFGAIGHAAAQRSAMPRSA